MCNTNCRCHAEKDLFGERGALLADIQFVSFALADWETCCQPAAWLYSHARTAYLAAVLATWTAKLIVVVEIDGGHVTMLMRLDLSLVVNTVDHSAPVKGILWNKWKFAHLVYVVLTR